jgi:hypothetical protein
VAGASKAKTAKRKKKRAVLMEHHPNGNGIRWIHCEKKRRKVHGGISGDAEGDNWAQGQRG